MKLDVKSVGLFLLGLGVLLIGVVSLHFYLTFVLPEKQNTDQAALYAHCFVEDNVAVIKVTN
ncbi:MAG: hypothetical protein GXO00_01390, partial [Candidatus Diapherotrites archaeon]|nr:hypothetical protein [Candidatus Diapherotrites archaeon]